uniref:Uncharacterized protein n=1 Tax=Equus asinus TaxID=9793 RepID=A0A9L0JC88_EQUAS
MRPRTGLMGHEAPWGQSPGPRQLWPLILLGLAVGTHGLLPPTAAPRGKTPGPGAPAGSSPWRLWDRDLSRGLSELDLCPGKVALDFLRPDWNGRGRAVCAATRGSTVSQE